MLNFPFEEFIPFLVWVIFSLINVLQIMVNTRRKLALKKAGTTTRRGTSLTAPGGDESEAHIEAGSQSPRVTGVSSDQI